MPDNDDDYVDDIAHKTIGEMTTPVMSPYTGRVYDKADIVQWINLKGTDPVLTSKPLTVAQLVPGAAVKQVAAQATKYNEKFTAIEQTLNDMKMLLKDLAQSNKDLHKENEKLQKENLELKKLGAENVWLKHGKEVDKKLQKGTGLFASAERTKALQDYKDKVLKAETEPQLKAAVQDTSKLKSKEISDRRYFTMFSGTSDTTRVAVEFQDKVTASKGW